jgi:hypothetical protein
MTFPCTCTDDARYRCPTHAGWLCHSEIRDAFFWVAECPPCFLERLRSVNLDSRATPTRGGHE